MTLIPDAPAVAMQVSREVVVASIQVDLQERVLARFRDDLLARVHQTGARGVILDVSGLEMLDSVEFGELRRIIRMVGLLGAQAVLVGLRPGVVSALVEAGVEIGEVRAALDLDAGFRRLDERQASVAEPEAPEQPPGEEEAGSPGGSAPEAQ